MIPQDPKGINFLLLEKNKSLVESLISLFNHALIRSSRGTSYTWHFVRLQERGRERGGGGKGLHQPLQRKRRAHQAKTKTTQSDGTAGSVRWENGGSELKLHSGTKNIFPMGSHTLDASLCDGLRGAINIPPLPLLQVNGLKGGKHSCFVEINESNVYGKGHS